MKLPTAPLTRVIKQSSRPFSLDRLDTTSSDTEFGRDQTYISDATTADIYVYQPSERPDHVLEGEQVTGSLRGLCLPSEDVQTDDRLEYAGGTWEIESKVPIDHGTETLAYQLSMQRV